MSQQPTLTVEAGNPEGLAQFYLTLGFTEVARDGGAVELQLGGLRLSIVNGPVTGPGEDGPTPSGFHLTVQIDDLDSIRAGLLATGGTMSAAQPVGGSGVLVLDPDGNPVRVLTRVAPTSPPTAPTIAQPSSGSTVTRPSSPGASATSAEPVPALTPTSTTSTTGIVPIVDDPDLPQSSLPATYYTDNGVPTFDAVAERIQQQSATADGNQILDAVSQRGQEESDSFDKLKKAGKDRLDQLRKSMGM